MSEDERDPFEDLDAPEDREGDPFERLDADASAAESREAETDTAESQPTDEFGVEDRPDGEPQRPPGDGWQQSPHDESGSDTTAPDDILSGVDTEELRSEPAPEDPFSGMDDRDEDPFGSGENVFERVDVERVDADEVWAEIAEDDTEADTSDGRYAEVSKHRYCEQCEFFSEPPDAHCTNEGTEILEFLDMETVRLLDCPIVAEQHGLEDEQ